MLNFILRYSHTHRENKFLEERKFRKPYDICKSDFYDRLKK